MDQTADSYAPTAFSLFQADSDDVGPKSACGGSSILLNLNPRTKVLEARSWNQSKSARTTFGGNFLI